MKYKVKRMLYILAVISVMNGKFNMPIECVAQETNNFEETMEVNEIVPYNDEIIYRYRRYNGKMQKRRWNKTTHNWVDPEWIDC